MYNAIIYGFTSPQFGDLPLRILGLGCFQDVFYLADGKNYYLNSDHVYVYNVFDLSFIKYPGYVPLDEIPPLDQEIIKEFAECEQICLKMFDRLEFWVDFPYEKRKEFYLYHLRYWHYVIDKFNINFLLESSAPHEIFDWIIYCILKKKNANMLFFTESFFYDRVVCDIDFLRYPYLHRKYDEYIKKQDIEISPKVLSFYNEKRKKPEIVTPPFYTKIRKRRGKISGRLKNIKAYNKKASLPNYDERYVYLALHYQPENTTCPLAECYVDQLLIVDMLSYYLPDGVMLYVKEHPAQTIVGRTDDYYKKISAYKNVRMIRTDVNTYELIDNAKCVCTCTGTVTIESIIRGTPVMMFGHFLYEFAPGVFPVKTRNEVQDALKRIFDEEYKVSEHDVKVYLQFMNDEGIEGFVAPEYEHECSVTAGQNIENIYSKIRGMIL